MQTQNVAVQLPGVNAHRDSGLQYTAIIKGMPQARVGSARTSANPSTLNKTALKKTVLTNIGPKNPNFNNPPMRTGFSYWPNQALIFVFKHV